MEQSQDKEGHLIELAKQGDRAAFGEIVERYDDAVIHLVYHLCGERQVSQDAAQEAFIRAWIKLPAFRPGTSFRNWLYRIAINAAVDMLRQKKGISLDATDEVTLGIDHAPDPEAVYVEKERAGFIQQAIEALPESARIVLILREFDGLAYAEIASILDIPIGTVMSRLNYARNRLKEMIKEKGIEPSYA